MKAIDPNAQPRESDGPPRGARRSGLPRSRRERRSRSNAVIAKRATQGLDIIHTGEYQEIPPAAAKERRPRRSRLPSRSPRFADIPAPTPDVLEHARRSSRPCSTASRAPASSSTRTSCAVPLEGLDDVVLETDGMPAIAGSARVLDLEPTDLTASYRRSACASRERRRRSRRRSSRSRSRPRSRSRS